MPGGTCKNAPLANEATSLPGNGLPRRTTFSCFARKRVVAAISHVPLKIWGWMLRGQSKHVLERRCRGKPTLGLDAATRYARSAHGDRHAHFLRQLRRGRHVVSTVMPRHPRWNRSIRRMTPSEVEVPAKFPLDPCFVFLIAGPCDIDHFLVCFACSPVFHKRHRVLGGADGIAKL